MLGDPIPTPYASGGWGPCPQTPIASGGWGIHPQTPQRPPPHRRFWLRACTKKNLLHVTAGLHLYYLLVLNMRGTFGEEDVLIHKRCIIRPKAFHPVILMQKNYLKKFFHQHQNHFGLGRDTVVSS